MIRRIDGIHLSPKTLAAVHTAKIGVNAAALRQSQHSMTQHRCQARKISAFLSAVPCRGVRRRTQSCTARGGYPTTTWTRPHCRRRQHRKPSSPLVGTSACSAALGDVRTDLLPQTKPHRLRCDSPQPGQRPHRIDRAPPAMAFMAGRLERFVSPRP